MINTIPKKKKCKKEKWLSEELKAKEKRKDILISCVAQERQLHGAAAERNYPMSKVRSGG